MHRVHADVRYAVATRKMLHPHLRQFDLKLLLKFQTLIETRSITEAAKQSCISQSAMSRVFARIQRMLKDECLVRTKQGTYQPTRRALALYSEFQSLLPRLERSLVQTSFDPMTAAA